MAPAAQTWVTLCTLIQEAFQCRLNATAPMAGHHGYAPALPFQQNAFGALAADDDEDKESIVEGMADQVAALTYQSQLTASTAATTNHHNVQQLATIEANQQATHSNLHQIIAQLNAVTFNASNAGWGQFGGRGHGCGCGYGFGCGLTMYVPGWFPTPHGGGIPPAPPPHGGGLPPGGGNHGGYQQGATQPSGYIPPNVFHSGQPQNPAQYRSLANAPGYAHAHQQPYSNLKKQFANWNVCYLCGFDVADAHTSMSCPVHLRKASHDIYFT